MSTASYQDQFAALASERKGPEWLPALRQAAMTRFAELGFPTTRNEDWHFTSVTPIAERTFKPVRAEKSSVTLDALSPYLFGAEDWHRLVFVNGRFDPALSMFAGLPAEVTVSTLADALKTQPELLVEELGKLAQYVEQPFTALNTAFMSDGVVIHVPADVVVEVPIHIVHVADSGAAGAALYPRTLVRADRHAQVTLVESFIGLDRATYLTNAVTELTVGEGAVVGHYKIQREAEDAYHVYTSQAIQAATSTYHAFSFASGSALSRTNIYTRLNGAGAEGRLNGLYCLDGSQHCDHQTFVEHIAPNCASRELYKGILDGSAHGVFNGKVYVDPEAQKTDGKQSNHTLLLSGTARIDSKPQLEIFADDVKCTHGATVGRLQDIALFYLKSRGISAVSARALLTYAFAAEVLETIEVDAIRLGLEALVFERFTNGVPA
ncbi:MAG: Fe-S cluster assembly protein SufD [Gemmatimonadaceae bacterium]|nr:Fe-S cluster assembly protein SufD [Gemmatimonadaceae bacterium]